MRDSGHSQDLYSHSLEAAHVKGFMGLHIFYTINKMEKLIQICSSVAFPLSHSYNTPMSLLPEEAYHYVKTWK